MLVKAFWEDRQADPIVKYSPGGVIPDDHPKREWLLRSKIAVDDIAPEVEHVREVEALDDDLEIVDPAPADDPVAAPAAAGGKPKPTDSVEKHREFLKKHGVDPKGLTRPQLVKAVAAIDV